MEKDDIGVGYGTSGDGADDDDDAEVADTFNYITATVRNLQAGLTSQNPNTRQLIHDLNKALQDMVVPVSEGGATAASHSNAKSGPS